MTTARAWNILADDLNAAEIPVTVTEWAYAEAKYGRVFHGVNRSITMRHPSGGTVTVRSRWSPHTDKWLGWYVDRDDKDGIVIAETSTLTSRSAVVKAVTRLLSDT